MPDDVKDLIEKLLVTDRNKRLGAGENDWKDVFGHEFFSTIDQKQLLDR